MLEAARGLLELVQVRLYHILLDLAQMRIDSSSVLFSALHGFHVYFINELIAVEGRFVESFERSLAFEATT